MRLGGATTRSFDIRLKVAAFGAVVSREARGGCGCNCGCVNPGHPRCGCCKSHPQPQRPQRQQSAGAAGVTADVTAGVGVRVFPHTTRSIDQPYGGAATPPRRATHKHFQVARTGQPTGTAAPVPR